eukprot:403370134
MASTPRVGVNNRSGSLIGNGNANGRIQKKISFELNIKSARITIPDQTLVTIYWVRGGKKIDTKTKPVMNNKATFNERFAMKTILDYNVFDDEYDPKPSILQLFKGNPQENPEYVGEADFDLAKYGKSVSVTERLTMRGNVTDDCFIEVMVKTKSLDAPQTPGPQASTGLDNRLSQQLMMTTRNSAQQESFFQRRNSVQSDADSEYLQFKEEFDKKEKEYRNRIHTLKKELTITKDRMTANTDLNESKQSLYQSQSNREAMYQFLDDETRKQVNVKDVKISLLKEHIDKAKAKQLEILKGPMKRVNRDCDILLNEILKLKNQFEKLDASNQLNRTKLNNYYSIDRFESISADLIARDLNVIDSCLLVKDKRKTGRVESNILFLGKPAAKKIMDKRNPGADLNDHYISLEAQKDLYLIYNKFDIKLSRASRAQSAKNNQLTKDNQL